MKRFALIVALTAALFGGVAWGSVAEGAPKPVAPAYLDPGGGQGRPACTPSLNGVYWINYYPPWIFVWQCQYWWPYYNWVFLYYYHD